MHQKPASNKFIYSIVSIPEQFISMDFFYSRYFKFVLGLATVFFSVDLYFFLRERQRKRIESNEISEAFFLISDGLQCHELNAMDVNESITCKNQNCKAKLLQKIVKHIDGAKHLICIEMYMCTMEFLSNALKRAHKRGVNIRFITDRSMLGTSNSQVHKLEEAGKFHLYDKI